MPETQKYAVSDAATLSIIETCNRAAGFATPTPGAPVAIAAAVSPPTLDAEGFAIDWAVNCRPEGCISSGPSCDTVSVRGQCSFPRAKAVELCKEHPKCVAINCNLARSDCQARDWTKRDPWRGMSSKIVKGP